MVSAINPTAGSPAGDTTKQNTIRVVVQSEVM